MKKSDVINTQSGKVQGYIEDELIIFKGIPYAEPPVGELRLNDPIYKESWEGLLEAFEYGPEVPQSISPLTPRPIPKQDEANCLSLNIWTPGVDEQKRPVMVWIHGGGFTHGSGSRIKVVNLAKRGNIVIVTINYRLGALANLVLSDAPGNIDMLDQITALKWIGQNIKHFGGDPDNITIFGESAGGQSVCILMTMPKAKGLFHRVIAQSGRAMPQGYKFSDRKTATDWLFEELNLKSGDLGAFRKLPVEKITAASAKVQLKATSKGLYLAFGPYIDGENLPEHPFKIIKKGFAKDIDLIIGSNLEEWKLWHMFNPNFKELEENALRRVLTHALKTIGEDENKANLVIETYIKSRQENRLPTKPQDIFDAFITDSRFHIPAVKFAEAHSQHQKNTYMYLFSWQSTLQGGKYGAMHALDIPFVFNTFLNQDVMIIPKRTEETEILSAKMMDAWISFARVGDPNHKNIPKWLPYDVNKRSTIVFDKEIKIWNDPLREERKMWYNMDIWSQF
ncbi:MAG: carboxylesterase/lipase family protein [Promethearchaeota archaeon]